MPPGLTRDDVTVNRAALTADAEGNPVGALSQVYAGRGTWGTPSVADQETADARGYQLDAVVAMASGSGVVLGDQMTVRGFTYTVLAIADTRLHTRYFLRKVGAT